MHVAPLSILICVVTAFDLAVHAGSNNQTGKLVSTQPGTELCISSTSQVVGKQTHVLWKPKSLPIKEVT
jgi:hypothetical protein